MKENWTYKKLGDVCQVVTGSTPKTNIPEYWSGKYPWITPAELKGDTYIRDTERHITDKAVAHTNLTLMPIGTVLLSSRAPIGKVAITEREMYCNQGFKNLICSDEINNKYLFLWLKGQTNYLNSLGRGATFKEISKNIVENIQIPLPPLSIQQSIVAELDEINNLLQLKKKELEIFDKLAQSIFYEMFGDPVTNEKGWEVKKLVNNVLEMFLGPFGSALKIDSYVPESESYAMVYEQKHAIQATLSLDNHYINEEKYNSLERFEVKGGDFIMSCRGTIGKLYRVPMGSPRGIIHPSLMKIRIKEDAYDPIFFGFMLKKIIANQTTKGNCVQMAITAKELGNKLLPIPSLSLQQNFATRIEAIEQQKELVKASINKLETLLASRMQYWFD